MNSKEKYEELDMSVIEFETVDTIITSDGLPGVPANA